MKFPHTLEPHPDLNILRLGSTNGKWELGIRAVMYGQRVSLSKVGDRWYTLDYCAADDSNFTWLLLLSVQHILDRYDEDVSHLKIEKDFPRFQFKPVNNDLCWGRLYKMAWGETLPFIECGTCQQVNYNPALKKCLSCGQPYLKP